MTSERTGTGLVSARATRRQVVRAGLAGALGLGTAAALGTPARAASAILRGSSRQTIKLVSWFQSDPERHAAWATLIHRFNTSQRDYKVIMSGWAAEAYANEVLLQAQAGRCGAPYRWAYFPKVKRWTRHVIVCLSSTKREALRAVAHSHGGGFPRVCATGLRFSRRHNLSAQAEP
jgi:hypothetical protein